METVVSLTVLSLLVVLVLNLFPSSITTLRSAESRYQASCVARSILDQQASGPWSKLTPTPPHPLASVEAHGVTFQPSLEIFNVPNTDTNYLRGLRVTVQWSEKGQPHQIVEELWVHNLPH